MGADRIITRLQDQDDVDATSIGDTKLLQYNGSTGKHVYVLPNLEPNTVRNGAGTPSSGLGVDGDFYVDVAAVMLYGPKTSGAWGSGTSLVGVTGAAGANGATWYAGAGAASSGLGINGDFYLRTSTGDVFQKSAGSWNAITNLTGPTGPAGPNQSVSLGIGQTFTITDHSGNPIFRVSEGGTVHIKTGTTTQADL